MSVTGGNETRAVDDLLDFTEGTHFRAGIKTQVLLPAPLTWESLL